MIVAQLKGRMANDNWIMTRHNNSIFAESEPEFLGLGHMLLELSRPKHGDDDVKTQKPGQYKSTDADNSGAGLIGSRSIH